VRLLILTQYYPPETGAPQNRLHELALRLKAKGIQVIVLTAMPNYPKMEIFEAYRDHRFIHENIDGIEVYRSRIFVRKSSSIFLRLLNYFSFTWTSFWTGLRKLPDFDVIMVESPPLFLGMSAYALARKKKAKMIFNVSDLWPESAEKLGLVTNRFFLKMATWLEEFLYRNTDLITGQTMGIVDNIKSRFPQKKVYWLPNGVDLTYFDPSKIDSNWRTENGIAKEELVLLYAGIIGHAQGLELILKAASQLKDEPVRFVLVGDGPVKPDLLKLKEELSVENVSFFDPVAKTEIPQIVKAADAAIIPLKKLPLFEGAIPSKIFENLAMKTPIILGVDGEARSLFIDEGRAGVFFEPENVGALVMAVKDILRDRSSLEKMGENGRKYVEMKFNRNSIAESFAQEVTSLRP
jgi:glycosyltransferase involved in cell wall biosynthesis